LQLNFYAKCENELDGMLRRFCHWPNLSAELDFFKKRTWYLVKRTEFLCVSFYNLDDLLLKQE